MNAIPSLKIFAACIVLTAGTARATTTETDYAAQVRGALLFSQPLEWIGPQKPLDAESLALLADIHVFQTNGISAGFGGLEKFLKAYPQSAWAPSVNVSVAEYYRGHGRYSLALAHWVNPNWLWFTAFVGANLFQSGITRWCLMEKILQKLGVGGSCCASQAEK